MIECRYYNDGQRHYEIPYREGQRHGVVKCWQENGKLIYEHPYYQDQLHGITKYYHIDGQIRLKNYYLYGNKVTEEEHRRHELIVKLSGL